MSYMFLRITVLFFPSRTIFLLLLPRFLLYILLIFLRVPAYSKLSSRPPCVHLLRTTFFPGSLLDGGARGLIVVRRAKTGLGDPAMCTSHVLLPG